MKLLGIADGSSKNWIVYEILIFQEFMEIVKNLKKGQKRHFSKDFEYGTLSKNDPWQK